MNRGEVIELLLVKKNALKLLLNTSDEDLANREIFDDADLESLLFLTCGKSVEIGYDGY